MQNKTKVTIDLSPSVHKQDTQSSETVEQPISASHRDPRKPPPPPRLKPRPPRPRSNPRPRPPRNPLRSPPRPPRKPLPPPRSPRPPKQYNTKQGCVEPPQSTADVGTQQKWCSAANLQLLLLLVIDGTDRWMPDRYIDRAPHPMQAALIKYPNCCILHTAQPTSKLVSVIVVFDHSHSHLSYKGLPLSQHFIKTHLSLFEWSS